MCEKQPDENKLARALICKLEDKIYAETKSTRRLCYSTTDKLAPYCIIYTYAYKQLFNPIAKQEIEGRIDQELKYYRSYHKKRRDGRGLTNAAANAREIAFEDIKNMIRSIA